jgi:hypothetical protein
VCGESVEELPEQQEPTGSLALFEEGKREGGGAAGRESGEVFAGQSQTRVGHVGTHVCSDRPLLLGAARIRSAQRVRTRASDFVEKSLVRGGERGGPQIAQ